MYFRIFICREVFKAREKACPKKIVAMKKVLMENEKEGFPITALREIRILQLLKQENVVNLIEICRTKATEFNRYRSTFYLVFDFCEHDLAGLLSNVNVKFNLGEIKKVMQQLLNGLYYIHSNKIQRNRVVTLWYRTAGAVCWATATTGRRVDLWGAGCIMAKCGRASPIMAGQHRAAAAHLHIAAVRLISPGRVAGVERARPLQQNGTVARTEAQRSVPHNTLRPNQPQHRFSA
ncbi:hypothetical protein LSTR_LSTR017223 [Laodelphax striatellus]|uniref:Protein kinase domain-containing protein n=1 Tax=Laodelphax striatellus TaxID=195883 RepID=A0A482WGK3_LAOST|nr:hypothetical protein LSTR_LSTR017223 [Laodelphax striatellus]